MRDVYKEAAEIPLKLVGGKSALDSRHLAVAGRTKSATKWAVHRRRQFHPFRGTYLDGAGQPDLLDRLNALLLVLPAGAAVGFQTAALLHGFGVVPAARLHIVLPRGSPIPQIRGVAAHEAVLPFEPESVLGVPCVRAPRCAVDLARTAKRMDALPLLDAALFSSACTEDDLLSEVHRHGRLRGIRQARELCAIADPRPACRQESQTRLLLHDARLPIPVPQLPVYDDDGYVRCVLDLGYEEERVGLEFDGASHLTRDRLRADRARHNWLAERGWRMRYITDEDLYRRPHGIVETMRTALVEARRSRLRAARVPRPPLPPIKE